MSSDGSPGPARRSSDGTNAARKESPPASARPSEAEDDKGDAPWWRSTRVVAPAICAVGLAVGVFGLGSTVHKHVVKGKDQEPEQSLQGSKPGTALMTDPAMSVKVARGETLWSIAQRANVPLADLKAANSIKGDVVTSGSTLLIPGRIEEARDEDYEDDE